MMNRYSKLMITIIISYCLSVSVVLAASSVNELESQLNSIRSMTADFEQTVTNVQGKVLQTIRGNLRLWRPGRFRWEISKPSRQTIVADGKSLYQYDQDLKQVSVKSLRKVWGTPALFLSESLRGLGRYYRVTQQGERYILHTISDKNNDFTQIELVIKGSRLLSMKMVDRLGHNSSIKFTRVKSNIAIDPEYFRFRMPKGVDVIN